MLRAVVTIGENTQVHFVAAEGGGEEHVECGAPETAADGTIICGPGPSPIMPEVKELAWSAGAFFLMLLLMLFVLYPRLKKGMDARYAHIRQGHERADQAKASAETEVDDYTSAVAAARAEANAVVDAARAKVEAERQTAIAEANAQIAARREAAAAEALAAKHAVGADIASAVSSVTTRTVELAIGRRPDDAVVRGAVDASMGAGAWS